MRIDHHVFNKIISLDNLFLSWFEFRRGKRNKKDVQVFERNLEDNLFKLHWTLRNNLYRHGGYKRFSISDPKPRIIHKAMVRDRVVHHAIFRILYPIFDPSFIFDSYSCRINKGTHKAVLRLEKFTKNTSSNYKKACFALKCDVSKFFASVDHQTLKSLISRRITDSKALGLIYEIIESFASARIYERERAKKVFLLAT